MPTTIQDDVTQYGSFTLNGQLLGTFSTARSNLALDLLKGYPIELQLWRVWDAFQTPLGSASGDDLGLTAGAFGTGCPHIKSGNGGTGSVTQYARAMLTLPPEYVAATDFTLRFAAGMLTAVSDTTATLDVEAYLSARSTLKTGSDLCGTAAQSINSLTFAEYLFTISGAGLVPGSVLDIRITIAITDAATATVYGAIAHSEALLSIRG